LYREANRNLELLRNRLLPKANQSLAVARTGYLSGQIDFFNLTDAERTLLDFKLNQAEASTQREVVLAELSLLVAGMSPSTVPMNAKSSGMARGGAARKSAQSGM
jgi:outer membrane protein, heavy metal efflux system